MNYEIIVIVAIIVILVSLQYTLNKILLEIREIKNIIKDVLWKDNNRKE